MKNCQVCGKKLSIWNKTGMCLDCIRKSFKGKNNPNYGNKWTQEMKENMRKIMTKKGKPKCIDCGERLKGYKGKRCKKCNAKILLPKLFKALKLFIQKKEKLIKICKFCKKEFIAGYKDNKNSYKRQFCSRKCMYMFSRIDLKRNEKIRKAVSHQIINHHKDGNPDNELKSNKLKIDATKHRQLHEFAYRYLVKIGKIDNYLKWFDKKYGLK